MDRMRFIPGKEAKEQIFDAKGHIYFGKETALDFADHFLVDSIPLGGNNSLCITYQTMLACMSDNDKVDIYFGLRDVKPEQGEEQDPTGELIGHTWATLTEPDPNSEGQTKTRILWEVGRATPPMQDAHAARAFNAYRFTLGSALEMDVPEDLEVKGAVHPDGTPKEDIKEFRGKAVMSRALSPSNLYYGSSVAWYFVDLGPPNELETPMKFFLSRPMRSFDALILASLMTLVNGSPPVVFGIFNSTGGLGKMPSGFSRVQFVEDEGAQLEDDKPILVL